MLKMNCSTLEASFSWLQDVTLQAAFRDFGTVQNVKVIREKGGERKTRTVIFWACDHLQLVRPQGRTRAPCMECKWCFGPRSAVLYNSSRLPAACWPGAAVGQPL